MADAAGDLLRVVRHLVEHPDEVRVESAQRGRTLVLEVSVAPGDMGSVIGRKGRTAQALRALLRARGDHQGVSYDLRIRDEAEEPAAIGRAGYRGGAGERR